MQVSPGIMKHQNVISFCYKPIWLLSLYIKKFKNLKNLISFYSYFKVYNFFIQKIPQVIM